jgi:DNA-binding PadR family transcriptional regulator
MGYLGEFEQLILYSVILLDDGAYGVAIREAIEERTGRVVSSGAIYTALGRLEERGLVRSRTGESGSGPGRPRKYYAIEPEGARTLKDSHDTMNAMAGGLMPKLADLAEG